jgi:hypothetical protein
MVKRSHFPGYTICSFEQTVKRGFQKRHTKTKSHHAGSILVLSKHELRQQHKTARWLDLEIESRLYKCS